jgi:hypothetical protein
VVSVLLQLAVDVIVCEAFPTDADEAVSLTIITFTQNPNLPGVIATDVTAPAGEVLRFN